METITGMSSCLLVLGLGLLCVANALGESASTDNLDWMHSQPDIVSRDVFVVNKTPLNDPDYTEFVHTMLKAKLESDGFVYVKVAGGELQRIKGADELDNIHIVGHSDNIFFDIAYVLLKDSVHSNVALLTRTMELVENGLDTVAALVHTTKARIDVFTMEAKPLERGSRTRRQVNGFNVYQQIAQATGGMVVHTDRNNIGSVVNLLKQAIKSNSVDILMFNFPGRNAGKHFQIPVDNTLTQMTMQIQTPSARPIVMITKPSGLPLPPTAGLFLGNTLELFEINMTKTTDYGQWKVLKAGGSDWVVKVTGQSPVDFSYVFMEPGPDGFGMYPLTGRPIAGRRYQLSIKVACYDIIKSVNIVSLVDSLNNPTGMPMMLHNVGGRRGKSMYVTNITIPTLDFKVAMDGMDKSNYQVRRLSPILVSPIFIDLVVPPMNNVQLYANDTLQIPFTIFNEASQQHDVLVKIEDTQGFARSPVNWFYTLKGGELHTGHFWIESGSTSALTSTVVITAKPYIRGQVTQGQFAIRRFTVQERTTTTTTTATSAAPHTTTVSATPTPPTTDTTTTTAAPPKTAVASNSPTPSTTTNPSTTAVPPATTVVTNSPPPSKTTTPTTSAAPPSTVVVTNSPTPSTTTTPISTAVPSSTAVVTSSPAHSTTTTPTTSADPPTTAVVTNLAALSTGQSQMTQIIPSQSTTPACNTGTSSSSSNQAPAGNASNKCGEKMPSNTAGSKPNVSGLHGFLHILLKHMDTDFMVEIAN